MLSKSLILGAACALATCAFALPAAAGGHIHGRAVHRNALGGVTAVHASGFRSARAAGKRGRRTVTDGQGNAHTASGGAWRGPQGSRAARAGETTRHADGSAEHRSGFRGAGADGGHVVSQGSAVRHADGSGSFARQTDAQGAAGGRYSGNTHGASGQGITHTSDVTGADGNRYQGTTTITRDGVTHSGTCYDAAGHVIACR